MLESDRAKRAHGGVKNKKFAEIVLIYAGSERSEPASDSAKLMQFIAAVFDTSLMLAPHPLPPQEGRERDATYTYIFLENHGRRSC